MHPASSTNVFTKQPYQPLCYCYSVSFFGHRRCIIVDWAQVCYLPLQNRLLNLMELIAGTFSPVPELRFEVVLS